MGDGWDGMKIEKEAEGDNDGMGGREVSEMGMGERDEDRKGGRSW